jgi:hypothetical protein
MKLPKESKEPDLFVVNKKLTAKEAKEFSDFIEECKKKNALAKRRGRAA